LVRVVESSLSCDLDEVVSYVPPRRRLTTGSHAEFVVALVHEFREALASLKGASELMARRRHELEEATLADLSAVIDQQAARLSWLVRLLEAVDGDGSTRRVEPCLFTHLTLPTKLEV
jgi:nitrogen-specific signal transduction histidine kinase